MAKIRQIIFISAFFIICFLPAAMMPFYEGNVSENRVAAAMPKFKRPDGSLNTDYFTGLSDYVTEHFAFRDRILKMDAYVKENILHSTPDHQVIQGREGWLFFDLALGDYAGATKSNEELEVIAKHMVKVTDYVRSLGKEPVFLIVPNKNNVYPEYMPGRFGEHAKENNLSILTEYMKGMDIPYVDALELLSEGKNVDEVYLHYDTHWNNTGARMVLNGLYEKLGIPFTYDIGNYTLQETHEPDLYNIIHPGSGYLESQHIYEDVGSYEYSGRFRTVDDLEIKTVNQEGNGEGILMYRDSFGRAVIPYMGQVFSECRFLRATPYDMGALESFSGKYVVIEIVERNLPMLGDIVIPSN